MNRIRREFEEALLHAWPGTKQEYFNLLTPASDEPVTSPYNIHTLWDKQVLRILKLIR